MSDFQEITSHDGVDIPEISQLMIIGISDTIMDFSINIQEVAKFDRVYHVQGIQQAMNMMTRVKFSVVVIDGDSDFDPISCSRIIRINNSHVRIILVSQSDDYQRLINLKNNGIIHAYIPMPSEILLAHSIIVQEQAKFEINQSLESIIEAPPRESLASRSFSKDQPISRDHSKFYFLGVAVVESTVMAHNLFLDKTFKVNSFMISSYLSAISIFGNDLFDSSQNFESFYFGDITISIYTFDTTQYVYFVRNVNNDNQEQVENICKTLSLKLQTEFGDLFIDNGMITTEVESDINQLIWSSLPRYQTRDNIYVAEEKPILINLDDPVAKLKEVYDETAEVYSIRSVDDIEQVMDLIKIEEVDVLISDINLTRFSDEIYRFSIIKEISPFTQIVAVTSVIDRNDVAKLLNASEIDFILNEGMDTNFFFDIIKRAIESSRDIRRGIYSNNPYQIINAYNKSAIVKTILRQQKTKFVTSTPPQLQGVFIIQGDEKLYSEFIGEQHIHPEEEMFTDFIQALLTFTGEFSKSVVTISGMEYGDSQMVVETRQETAFIYFIKNLDSTNYDLVEEYTQACTESMYQLVQQYFLHEVDNTDQADIVGDIERLLSDDIRNLKERLSKF